jgi:hypothetical protein
MLVRTRTVACRSAESPAFSRVLAALLIVVVMTRRAARANVCEIAKARPTHAAHGSDARSRAGPADRDRQAANRRTARDARKARVDLGSAGASKFRDSRAGVFALCHLPAPSRLPAPPPPAAVGRRDRARRARRKH